MAIKMRINVKSSRQRRPAQRLKAIYKKEVLNMYKRMGMKGINNIKSEIKKRNLVDTGAMLRDVHYKITEDGVRFEVGPEYAQYVNKGVHAHQMVYLTKSDKPIPIDIANGLFRWASKKSMARGKWKHPGFMRGKGFIRSAVMRTRSQLSTEIKQIARKTFKP